MGARSLPTGDAFMFQAGAATGLVELPVQWLLDRCRELAARVAQSSEHADGR